MSSAMTEMIGKTFERAIAEAIGPVGPPFCRSFGNANGVFDLEVGFPVSENVSSNDEVHASALPGGLMAHIRHVGPFDRTGPAYKHIETWIEANGMEKAGDPWEVYLTDPDTEPDPEKYQVDIFWPVRHA